MTQAQTDDVEHALNIEKHTLTDSVLNVQYRCTYANFWVWFCPWLTKGNCYHTLVNFLQLQSVLCE